MSAASVVRVSTVIVLQFIANSSRLVANAFSSEQVVFLSCLVRSYQLCCVAGSLWGRPHFYVGAMGKRPLA
jgi:hypothetical protein